MNKDLGVEAMGTGSQLTREQPRAQGTALMLLLLTTCQIEMPFLMEKDKWRKQNKTKHNKNPL